MSGKYRQSGNGSGACSQLPMSPELHEHKNRQPAFEGIEQQGQYGSLFIAAAQHIGGTGVAAAVLARVIQAHHAADDHGKTQRAQGIGRHSNKRQNERMRHGQSRKKMKNNPCVTRAGHNPRVWPSATVGTRAGQAPANNHGARR